MEDRIPCLRLGSLFVSFLSLLSLGGTVLGDEQVPLTQSSSNDTLLWGPYRPNLYFGVRPRLPNSILAGLAWANADTFDAVSYGLRHTCEQGEDMQGYGWDEYDARTGNKIDLTIDFVKAPGPSGGSWAARVQGKPMKDASKNIVTTLFFHVGLEGLGDLAVDPKTDRKGTVILTGQADKLGDFTIEVTAGKNNKLPHKVHPSWDEKPLDRTLITSLQVPPEHLWAVKNIIIADVKPNIDRYAKEYGTENIPPPWAAFTISDEPRPGNFHIIQKVLVGAFDFDIFYNSGAGPHLTSEDLDKHIAANSKSFKTKFDAVLKPSAPFTKAEYTGFSQSLFSNLLGGVGYFYGDSLVDRSYAPEYDEDDEGFWEQTAEARARAQVQQDPARELFTAVPSRPFFPRGFLWDEGFHLVPIVEWDLDLTLDILSSWFNLMDSDGWIAREQILGAEARSKVPQEFQVQYPHYANPPTLFLIIETLVAKLKSGKLSAAQAAAVREHLTAIYPLLKRQYTWFRRTQFGDVKSYDRDAPSTKEAYRWRGRSVQHILTSGLDDYPRPQPPHPGELHVDLFSWVGLMQRALISTSTLLSETDDTATFTSHHNALLKNLDVLHWSDKDAAYCDASIDDYDESYHVCHKGYISLFPFMTGLVGPTNPNLPAVLDLIADPEHLWSPYGIRSLSKQDPHYGTEENYWRSPIWVPMNYLIIKQLRAVAVSAEGSKEVKVKAAKIYNELRENLVKNVYQQWKETGFAWEQYNPETGKGQRTQHFTGWTSLVVSIMAMERVEVKGGVVVHGEL
ncbi:putative mannosyl-oligosaccharide glucosidase [Cyphellophora attinorum]|uniref:Mannosyl-oligosaccharide glucosidase n=1 Tax=Cyphellophora attinorum TaxID=1664694 RepID=A0A0N1HDC1_9EURO|nr:putative mannosyl-oligosaccharide glucosidase [Phialophora attinorum]KPI42317.1 putative mannosyl-oligosaccharide glucosidase [Phialophora attinorum]